MAEKAKQTEKKEEAGKTTTSGDVVKEIWDAFINTLSEMYKNRMTALNVRRLFTAYQLSKLPSCWYATPSPARDSPRPGYPQ